MFKVTLKSLAAKKLRLVLTSIAVVLGVAFMAGHLRAHRHARQRLRRPLRRHDEGRRRGRAVAQGVRGRRTSRAANTNTRPPVPESLVERGPQDRGGRRRRRGRSSGYALVIGKDGDAVQNQAPTLGTPLASARTSP